MEESKQMSGFLAGGMDDNSFSQMPGSVVLRGTRTSVIN